MFSVNFQKRWLQRSLSAFGRLKSGAPADQGQSMNAFLKQAEIQSSEASKTGLFFIGVDREKLSVVLLLLALMQCGCARVQTAPQPAGPVPLFLAFVCVAIVGIVANACLVSIVRTTHQEGSSGTSDWKDMLEFSPLTLGGFFWRNLALWSLLSLFLELLMIRWISSEISIFAYFKNFVLIACFLGFGLGCYLSRRKINLLLVLIPMTVLAAFVRTPWDGLRVMTSLLPTFVGASAGTQVWGIPSGVSFPLLAAATAVIVPIFGLIAFCFVPLGQMVGWYLENSRNGILAYSVNVIAGLTGIAVYTTLSFLSLPPSVWFLCAGALLLLLLWRVPRLRWASAVAFTSCIAMLSLNPPNHAKVYWSPYQKLTLIPREEGGQTVAYVLNTNDSWYQQILDLSPQFVQSHPQFFQSAPVEWNAYNIPYHFFPQPSSVLILGSGMGNDVAAALRNGAAEVTAVEIDPLILKLGRELHFEKPYSSPRVRQITNDARSYIQNSNDRFDLIVFSLLDSHTTSSNFTNIRIDNYVYTSEALQAAKHMLKPAGVFIVKFQVSTPWIAGRLYALLAQVFGHAPLQLEADSSVYTTGGRFFVTGSEQRLAQALSDPALAKYVEKHRDMRMEPATLTTDDWPYFYQRSPGLPLPVVVISSVLVLLCLALVRDTGTQIRSVRWHFFFLGAGFLLLEAQIISKMALLFGTTWVVNSIVISGLLLLILTANLVVSIEPNFPVFVAYGGLFVTLSAGLLVPLDKLLFSSLWARILSAGIVLCLPVFFAGIVFIKSFAREAFSGEALGSNLLGAMVGGMLESVSMWTGIRSLLAFAAALYLASWLSLAYGRKAQQNPAALCPLGNTIG
jgi:spermidine synthase